jgi:rhodanese-related sulfurtransferase
MNLREILANPSVTIIDVREPFEYFFGHIKGSVNIPLGQVPGKVAEFKQMGKPIVLVCASGNRSGQATEFLKKQGLTKVYNGGGWSDVKQMLAKQAA